MDRSIQNSEISNIFSSKTALSKFAYSDLMVYVISCDIPTLSMPCLRAIYIYIYIYTNAFLKSMKLWKRFIWTPRCFSMIIRQFMICSTVLRPLLKPAFSSERICSACVFNISRSIFNIIVLALLIKVFDSSRNLLNHLFLEKGLSVIWSIVPVTLLSPSCVEIVKYLYLY